MTHKEKHNHKNEDEMLEVEEKKHTPEKNETQQNASENSEQAAGPASLEIDETQKLENQVEAEIVDLNERLGGLNDKYLRLMAEFDNFKRRTAREYEKLVEGANERLILEIIDVRENMERALKTGETLPAESQGFLTGIKLIFDKLENILKRQGLEVFCEKGDEFNPELHDAMIKVPHAEINEEHIAEVCEKGYKLKGRVIKHAKVMVSSGAPEPK